MAWNPPKAAEQRQAAILKNRATFLKKAQKIQSSFKDLIERILLDNMRVEGGNIVSAPVNFKEIQRLGVVMDAFHQTEMKEFLGWMGERMQKIEEINSKYFKSVTPDQFNSGIERNVRENLSAKYGLNGSQVVRNGLMSGIGAAVSQASTEAVKRAALSGISQGLSFKDFKNTLRDVIDGQGGGLGVVENHLYTAAYDTFQQYDREAQRQFAKELSLNYAIYSGDIRDTSRDWCQTWVGKVLSRGEIEQWKGKDWAGKNKNGYDPFTDCGGYNCTHIWNWISDELAFELRPDLIKNNPPPKKPDDQPDAKTPQVKFTPVKDIKEARNRFKNIGITDQISITKGFKTEQANEMLRAFERVFSAGRLNALTKVRIINSSKVRVKGRYFYDKSTYRFKNATSGNVLELNNRVLNETVKKKQQTLGDKIKMYEDAVKTAEKNYKKNVELYGSKNINSLNAFSRLSRYKRELDNYKQMAKKGYSKNLKFSVEPKDNTIEGWTRKVTNHELGHHLHLSRFKEIDHLFEFNRMTVPSEYAMTNKKEYFAEWYAHYMEYGDRNVPQDILKVFKMIE